MGKRIASTSPAASAQTFSLTAQGRTVSANMLSDGLIPGSLAAELMAAAADHAGEARLARALQNPACLPDFAGSSGMTPLMAAALRGNKGAVELLSAHPLVSLDRQDRAGWTALHYAAAFGHADCVTSLLRHHALPGIASPDKRLPLDVAASQHVEQAFWDNPSFRRYMQRHDPERLPLPVQHEPAAPEPRALEPDPLKEAFFKAATALSLQQATRSEDSRRQMILKIAALDEEPLKDVYKRIRLTEADFDWHAVFAVAACKGNTAALRFLQDEFLFDQDTLDLALAASIADGDQRDAAHHLLIWGANPAAPYAAGGGGKGKTIFNAAFSMNRAGAFEEMVTWRGDKLRKSDAESFKRQAVTPALREGLDVHAHGERLRRLGARDLSDEFYRSAMGGNLGVVMAAYAEAKRSRWLRRSVELDRGAAGGAIALAIRLGRPEFARLLLADGYRLQDAPEYLKTKLHFAPPETRQFADDLLAGKLKISSVRNVGERKRRELRALMVATPRGHYGVF